MNAPIETLRVPPHSVEAEQSVLGGLLLDNSAWDRIADFCGADQFYRYDHRVIFEHIVRLINNSKPADVITVFESLGSVGKAEDVGGLSYLNALAQNTPSAANIRRYAEIVHDRAQKREIIIQCDQVSDMAFNSQFDASQLIDQLSTKFERLTQTPAQQEPERVTDNLAKIIEDIDARYHGAEPDCIPTGFTDLDRILNGGLEPGNLIIVAGRPKMGKTSFAMNIATNIAARGGVVEVISMEMMIKQLHQRLLSSVGGIPLNHIIDAKKFRDEDWPRLTHAIGKLNEMELYLDTQPGLTLMQVRTKAKHIKRKMKSLDLLVIDYLQLMSGDGDNRNSQIEVITRGLKCLAKELGVPIILLSQLNRELEKRPNKRPLPSDLRDSGAIEQDCDLAIFLYRDEVYNPDSDHKGMCEVNVALNRQGASGVVPLVYVGEQTRFEDYAHASSWHPAPPKTKPVRNRGFADD